MSGEQAADPAAPVLIHLTDDLNTFAAIIRRRLLLAIGSAGGPGNEFVRIPVGHLDRVWPDTDPVAIV